MSAPLLTDSLSQNGAALDQMLRVEKSFDLICRELTVCGRGVRIYFIDGFAKDDILEKIMSFLLGLAPEDLGPDATAETVGRKMIPYIEVETAQDMNILCTQVLSGQVAILFDKISKALMVDARTYPVRSVSEPDDDRVLRGARDGFVETLVSNTSLIRRRIRDPGLTMEYLSVGSASKTDIVLCYLDQKVERKVLDRIREKIQSADVSSLSMGQESLAEALLRRQLWNPFPKVRYTERPDAAAASVLEGKVIVIIDNSPSVMLLPVSFFEFFEEVNDYYFPPLVGSYLRLTRYLIFFLTLFLIPVWYLLIQNPGWLPPALDFLKVKEPNTVPIFIQLMMIELIIDCLKQASLNTPSVLSSSFSVVGAMILGEFAVRARWFVPEVLLYMAFVAIANFTQPSFELGYAFKLCRILLVVLTALFNVWGFAAGCLIILFLIASTRTISEKSYLYPLIPFDGPALCRILLRMPIRRNSR